ncbi:MAG: O-antigen ligase family protein [Patescibacteria group bacterium]|nr:O-antigen ligase family protein [Patescibacteria group bacterium]
MFLKIRNIYLEYSTIFILAFLAGAFISFYNLSVLFILILVLFVIMSFKYFNQMLLLLILYIPFQLALNITSGVDLASSRVFILYLFAVWVLKSLAEKKFVIRLNLQTILIYAFLVLALFSMFQAWDTERAVRKILVFLSIFPLYFILSSVEISKHNLYKIIKMLVIGGILISLIGIIQFISQFILGIDLVAEFWSKYIAFIFYGKTFGSEVISNPSWLVNVSGMTIFRGISLFPDPHMLSFYLGLIIPIILAIALVGKKNININSFVIARRNDETISGLCARIVMMHIIKIKTRLLHFFEFHNDKHTFFSNKLIYIILFIMFLAEFLTFSRGGYIGMIAGIGILIILSWKYLSANKKILIGMFFSLFLFIILFTNQSIVNRFFSSFDLSEGSNAERIKNWHQGWEVFSENILTGVGIGNYSIYLYPTIEYRTPVYAHNLYLDIGAEMGIFALIVWLLLIGVTIWQLYKTSKSAEDNFFRALSLGLIGSIVWFSFHGIFDTPIYSPTILAIFMVIISLASMILSKEKI